jgi:hypothetical protein
MKVTLNIQDQKAPFLLELLRSLEYVSIEEQDKANDSFVLSDNQISQLEERSKTPDEVCISREDFEKKVKKKYDF